MNTCMYQKNKLSGLLSLLLLHSAFLCLSITGLNSQNLDPAAGRLITASGDTLKCVVNLESELKMSKRVEVDAGEGFYFIEVTELEEVLLSESGIRLRKILHTYVDYERRINQVEVYRLGQLLVDGPLQLFRVPVDLNEYQETSTDIPSWVYYIAEKGNSIPLKLEVKERQYADRQNVVSEEYKDRLQIFFADYPELVRAANRLTFNDKRISAIVVAYNDLKYGIGEGKALENKGLTNVHHSVRVLTTHNSRIAEEGSLSNNYGLGYAVDFQNPFSGKLMVGVGIEYFIIGYKESIPLENLLIQKGSIVRVPIRTRYALLDSSNRFNVSITGGMNLTHFSYRGERQRFEAVINPGGIITLVPSGYAPFSAKDVRFLFSVGVGIEFDSLFLEAFYEGTMRGVFSLGYRF